MKVLRRFFSILAILCYILIFLVLFVAAPMVVGYKPVVVLSASMEPAYPVGSVIYSKAASYESIKEGDVISFSVSDDAQSLVTHRVDEIEEINRAFITKGDANVAADVNPVSYNNVRGKVIGYYLPYAGFLVEYIQNYYVIGGIFLILLAKIIIDNIGYKEEKAETAAE